MERDLSELSKITNSSRELWKCPTAHNTKVNLKTIWSTAKVSSIPKTRSKTLFTPVLGRTTRKMDKETNSTSTKWLKLKSNGSEERKPVLLFRLIPLRLKSIRLSRIQVTTMQEKVVWSPPKRCQLSHHNSKTKGHWTVDYHLSPIWFNLKWDNSQQWRADSTLRTWEVCISNFDQKITLVKL
jgi:hypothetical protein